VSKFSSFERIDKEFYPTIDPKSIPPNFLKHIKGKTYAEPCCGAGDLINLIGDNAVCRWKSDLNPAGCGVAWDAMKLSKNELEKCELIVTNPPYLKDVLLPLISHLSSLRPTWMLLPADIMHNGYMVEPMKKCERVVSIGRLYWFVNEWVVKHPFDYDELDKKWDKQVSFYDSMKGIKYYDGYLTNQGKPCKTEFVRGTDNYGWYLFQDYECDTTFQTRGDN